MLRQAGVGLPPQGVNFQAGLTMSVRLFPPLGVLFLLVVFFFVVSRGFYPRIPLVSALPFLRPFVQLSSAPSSPLPLGYPRATLRLPMCNLRAPKYSVPLLFVVSRGFYPRTTKTTFICIYQKKVVPLH